MWIHAEGRVSHDRAPSAHLRRREAFAIRAREDFRVRLVVIREAEIRRVPAQFLAGETRRLHREQDFHRLHPPRDARALIPHLRHQIRPRLQPAALQLADAAHADLENAQLTVLIHLRACVQAEGCDAGAEDSAGLEEASPRDGKAGGGVRFEFMGKVLSTPLNAPEARWCPRPWGIPNKVIVLTRTPIGDGLPDV